MALKRRSPGTLSPSPAAEVAASVGATYLPDLFFRSAVVKLFCRAKACSTYPTAPLFCLTQAPTPSLPLAPVPVGHLTVLSTPGPFFHSGLYAARNVVNSLVVPDSSERWQTVMLSPGRSTPAFCPLIDGSSHFLTFPRKMLATVAPSSFRP